MELERDWKVGHRVKALLTRLPDALGGRQGVAEDAFVPEASEAMNHLSSLVQNHTLNLVLAAVGAPVAGLEGRGEVH